MEQRLLVQTNGNEQDWIYERDSSVPREQNRESWQSQHSQGTRGLPISFEGDDLSTRPPEGFRPSFHSAPGVRFHPGAATNWLRSQQPLLRRLDRKQPRHPRPSKGGGAFLSR